MNVAKIIEHIRFTNPDIKDTFVEGDAVVVKIKLNIENGKLVRITSAGDQTSLIDSHARIDSLWKQKDWLALN